MTKPTEAEIEAATEAVRKIWLTADRGYRDIARAALTAAAQVRERAGAGRSLTPEESKLMDQALMAGTKPDLMPIYGATEAPSEPDYGPDVLGERPGKE